MAGMGPVGNVGISQEEGWKTQPGVQAYRSKVVAEIDDTVRSVGNPTQKSTIELEEHVFQRAKSIEEYLMLGARLNLHMRDYIKKQKDAHAGKMPVGQRQDYDSYPQPQQGGMGQQGSSPHSNQMVPNEPSEDQWKRFYDQGGLQQQPQQQQPGMQAMPNMAMLNMAMANNMQTNMSGNMQVNMQPQPIPQGGMGQQGSLPRSGNFPPQALQQLLQTLKSPHSPQQQKQVLAILKSNPQLMAAFIRQRTQQAQLLQQQQAAQQAQQVLQVQRNLQQTFLAQQKQQQPQQQPGMQTMPNIAMPNNIQTNMPGNMQVNMQPQPTTQERMEQQGSLPLQDITTVVANT